MVVHVQCIGFHIADKHLCSDVREAFFVPAVGKKEQNHAGEGQQKAQAEEQLPEGNRGMLFQKIT